jgi:hypothetical protein
VKQKIIILIISLSLIKATKSYSQEKIISSVYLETYYSGIRKIQDNLIPYFYHQNGCPAFTIGYSAKMKTAFFLIPQIDIGLNTSSYKLKHFEKIQDTARSIFLENWFTYNTLSLKVATTANFAVTKIFSGSIGASFYIPLVEKETNKIMLVDGLFSSENSTINSTKNSAKNIKSLLINLRGGISAKASKQLSVSFLLEYGLSYIRNVHAVDFLSRQTNFGFCLNYSLSKSLNH